jgi:hypothetical protein
MPWQAGAEESLVLLGAVGNLALGKWKLNAGLMRECGSYHRVSWIELDALK